MLYYLAAVNLIAFFISWQDKLKAQRGKRRISESTLFTLALAGGSVGEYLSMLTFRHKTKHKRFMIGLPVIMICQALLLYVYKGLYI